MTSTQQSLLTGFSHQLSTQASEQPGLVKLHRENKHIYDRTHDVITTKTTVCKGLSLLDVPANQCNSHKTQEMQFA